MPFKRYAWGVLGVNLFVILWGALVRATGSGAGCGRHWPLCDGEIIPPAPATATLIEYTYRATSGLALLLVIGLFWWSRREFPPRHRARQAAVWSLGFMGAEALIGAGLVLFRLVGENDSMARAGNLSVHLVNTFLLLAALALTAHWSADDSPWHRPAAGAAPWLLAGGLLALLLLGVTGAVAALGNTLFPSTSLAQGLRANVSPMSHPLIRLRVLHPLFALMTGAYLSLMVWQVARLRPDSVETRWGRRLTGLVLLQLGVGIASLLLFAPTTLQLTHLLVADLLWISQVIFTAAALSAAPAGAARTLPCPQCGSRRVLPIAYGLPGPELQRLADQGRVALGGCVVGPDSPQWRCGSCGHSFGGVEAGAELSRDAP